MTQQMLTAVFPEAIRDEVIDALIGLTDITGFNLSAIDGYSREHSQYDISEQVTGYRRMCRLEVAHPQEHQALLIAALSGAASGSHLHYWVTPVLESGVTGKQGAYQ